MSTDATIEIVRPDLSLLQRLLPVARGIFSDTFADRYDREAFEAYCETFYSRDGTMSGDFLKPEIRWWVATAAGNPIGYVKLTPLRTPAINPDPRALEMEQLYVMRDWHGKGVADQLLQWALATARRDSAREVYLTVFDHNERAKRFYARHGFVEVGRCTFQLGDRIDDDRIWRLNL